MLRTETCDKKLVRQQCDVIIRATEKTTVGGSEMTSQIPEGNLKQ